MAVGGAVVVREWPVEVQQHTYLAEDGETGDRVVLRKEQTYLKTARQVAGWLYNLSRTLAPRDRR